MPISYAEHNCTLFEIKLGSGILDHGVTVFYELSLSDLPGHNVGWAQ